MENWRHWRGRFERFCVADPCREELGTCSGLTVTLVGDLKNGRTVHSLCAGCAQYETTSLEEVMPTTDFLYVTRFQKERFEDVEEYKKVADSYIITSKTLLTAKQHMIVMHPLPRINEIAPEVDFDQRAAYFRQMRYGLYVRMALLALVIGRSTKE